MRVVTILLMIGALTSGCSVNYKMVGQFDDYNELIVGDLNHDLLIGVAQITAKGERTGVTCKGQSRVTYIPPLSLGCAGQRGTAKLNCEDGRVANAEWTATSCTTGFGDGQTSDGLRFQFTFGLTREEAAARLAQMRPAAATKPEPPVYKPKETRKKKGFSTGTGFFVTSAGHLVTNYHVIEDAKSVAVSIKGKLTEAALLKSDPANDLTLLKVETTSNPIPIPSQTRIISIT